MQSFNCLSVDKIKSQGGIFIPRLNMNSKLFNRDFVPEQGDFWRSRISISFEYLFESEIVIKTIFLLYQEMLNFLNIRTLD